MNINIVDKVLSSKKLSLEGLKKAAISSYLAQTEDFRNIKRTISCKCLYAKAAWILFIKNDILQKIQGPKWFHKLYDLKVEEYKKESLFQRKLENLAKKLKPGYENYTYHADKERVYYGNDWEEEFVDKNENWDDKLKGYYLTKDQLTTNYKKELEKKKIKEFEGLKNANLFSFNEIISILDKNKLETKKIENILDKKIKQLKKDGLTKYHLFSNYD